MPAYRSVVELPYLTLTVDKSGRYKSQCTKQSPIRLHRARKPLTQIPSKPKIVSFHLFYLIFFSCVLIAPKNAASDSLVTFAGRLRTRCAHAAPKAAVAIVVTVAVAARHRSRLYTDHVCNGCYSLHVQKSRSGATRPKQGEARQGQYCVQCRRANNG